LALRAARITAHNGYPLEGFTLLRNILDDCVLTSAAMQGLTDFEELAGIKPGENFDPKQSRKNRIAVERRVRSQMDGEKSGLSLEVREHLAAIDQMYDLQTHGARLTSAYNLGWLKGSSPLSITPIFREEVAALFMNRFIETAWMCHRLVPFIQLPGFSLSSEWAAKWRLIDESFNHLVMSLFRDLKKPYFEAVCKFVSVKFPFNAGSRFPL
jgi:hypothetical protein